MESQAAVAFMKTHTMMHSRGLTGSVQIPRLLICQKVGWGRGRRVWGEGGDAFAFGWRARGWVAGACARSHDTLQGLCCFPVKDEGLDSLHVPVNFRCVRAADWTSAIGLRNNNEDVRLTVFLHTHHFT